MGKINKKLQKKNTKTPEKKSKQVFNIGDCFIKLHRCDRIVEEKKIQRETYNIDVKIHENLVSVGDKKLKLKNTTQNINIGLSFRLNEAIVKCCNVVESVAPSKTVTSTVKSLKQIIDAEWHKAKTQHDRGAVVVGLIVMGKMKGYPPWPGLLQSFTKNGKRAQLRFFGTHNTGSVEVTEIVPFDIARDTTRLLLLRPLKFFFKAVLEVERIMQIDDEYSLTNGQKCIL